MAAIDDLADLYVATSEYVKDADFGHLFQRFVAMTEIEINRALRIERQHKTATITLTAGRGTLPVDFLQVSSVRSSLVANLKRISKQLEADGECEYGYTFDDDEIVVFPDSTESVVLDYYAKVPDLTEDNPTNWMLATAPDVYLSGLVYQVLMWKRDDGAASARDEFYQRLADVGRSDRFARMSNSRITTHRSMP